MSGFKHTRRLQSHEVAENLLCQRTVFLLWPLSLSPNHVSLTHFCMEGAAWCRMLPVTAFPKKGPKDGYPVLLWSWKGNRKERYNSQGAFRSQHHVLGNVHCWDPFHEAFTFAAFRGCPIFGMPQISSQNKRQNQPTN